jgi:hypothetical protein
MVKIFWSLLGVACGFILVALILTPANARSIQPGRYQMQASNTYVYVLDTATGKMHAYRMKLDVMDEICIQYTPRCNDDN